jgi:hypothetical protein
VFSAEVLWNILNLLDGSFEEMEERKKRRVSMKKLITAVVGVFLGLAVAAYAQGPGYGPGWRAGGPGWGPGMMGPGYGWGGMGPGMMYACPEYGSPEYSPGEAGISADKAKEIAQGVYREISQGVYR